MLPRPCPSRSIRPSTCSSRGGAACARWSWSGRRTRPGGGAVRIVDGDGVDRTAALPELAGLAVRIAARSAILDGELVVVDGAGRADPAGADRASRRRARSAAAFLAFDLLGPRRPVAAVASRSSSGARRSGGSCDPGDEVVAVPAIAAEGRALYDAVVAQGIAGILARQRSSPYLPGVRSRLWRYVAARPRGAPSAEPTDAARDRRRAAAPVLALISRLPARRRGRDSAARRRRLSGRPAPRRRDERPQPRPLAVEQDTRGVHPGRRRRPRRRSRRRAARSTARPPTAAPAETIDPGEHHERAERRQERARS